MSELPAKEKYYKSETFLTDLPELCTTDDETTDHNNKPCMPAFLPTIQAKAHAKKLGASQLLTVQKYLMNNDMTYNAADVKPFTADTTSSDNTLTCVSVLRKSVLPRQIHNTPQKAKKRKTAKHKTKYKQTGKKKGGKLYIGKSRELSTTNSSSVATTNSSRSFHSLISPQEDLVTHFSRISMRQVQATLNNSRLALPSIA